MQHTSFAAIYYEVLFLLSFAATAWVEGRLSLPYHFVQCCQLLSISSFVNLQGF